MFFYRNCLNKSRNRERENEREKVFAHCFISHNKTYKTQINCLFKRETNHGRDRGYENESERLSRLASVGDRIYLCRRDYPVLDENFS